MKRFLIKLLIFLTPFYAILISYVVLDPFKVLRSYHDYSGSYAPTNNDYVSTETYLKKRLTYRYNSFIFGSSRAGAFSPTDWSQHLSPGSKPFLFWASLETLHGIYMKLLLIDEANDHIQNALMIIDTDTTFFLTPTGHMFIKHPALSRTSVFSFQFTFVQAYFQKAFFIRYLDFTLFHQFRPYMKDYICTDTLYFDPVSNAYSFINQEKEWKNDPVGYYQKRKSIFYSRDMHRLKQVEKSITSEYLDILYKIRSIFQKHKTNYKIIISPLYDQSLLNREDLSILYSVFGESRVFDYSGINKYTRDIKSYYETAHYTKEVGKDILNAIYNN